MPYNRYIGILGGRDIEKPLYDECLEIGRQLAKLGLPVINGGGEGVMEAVSRGVKEAGGTTIGLLPGEQTEANQYIDYPIGTGIGIARNLMLVRNSTVIAAIDGSHGTLSEIAFALQYGIPITAFKSQWSHISGVHVSKTISDIMTFIAEHI